LPPTGSSGARVRALLEDLNVGARIETALKESQLAELS
jgi:hypothetical protein